MSRGFDVVGGDAAARVAVEAAAPARRWHPVEAAGGLLTSAGCGLRVAPPCAQPSELLTLADGGTMRLTWCVARAHARSAAPLTRARTRQVYRNGPERATRRGNRHSRSRQHVALAIRAHRMRPPCAPRVPHCVRRPARIARHPAHLAATRRARRMARRPPHRRSNTRGDFAHSPPAARRASATVRRAGLPAATAAVRRGLFNGRAHPRKIPRAHRHRLSSIRRRYRLLSVRPVSHSRRAREQLDRPNGQLIRGARAQGMLATPAPPCARRSRAVTSSAGTRRQTCASATLRRARCSPAPARITPLFAEPTRRARSRRDLAEIATRSPTLRRRVVADSRD